MCHHVLQWSREKSSIWHFVAGPFFRNAGGLSWKDAVSLHTGWGSTFPGVVWFLLDSPLSFLYCQAWLCVLKVYHRLFMYVQGFPESNAPCLWCWPVTSKAGVDGMAVEIESFHCILLLYDRWQQRDSLTKWCLTWKWREAWRHSVPPCGENGTHWHSSMLAGCLWRPNSGCEYSEAVGAAFQQWWQWVTSTGADVYKHGMQTLVHRWQKCVANCGEYVEK